MPLRVSNPGFPPRGAIGRGIATMGVAVILATTPLAVQSQEPASGAARVTGVVYDSIAAAPIAGVTVQFVGTEGELAGRMFSAEADEAGRYALDGLPVGRYMAGFFHAALDTLGLELGPQLVEVREGLQTVPLATPSPRTLSNRICPATPASEGMGLLLGHVRSASNETAIEGAFVVVEWNETIIGEGGIQHRDAQVHGATTGPGWFAICHVPTDAILHARASFGADSSGWIAIEVPPDGMRHVTFFIGPVTRVALGAGDEPDTLDTLAPRVLGGSARLSGVVRDPQGRPIRDAIVAVWETGKQAMTDGDGRFSLEGLPDGTHMLEARMIGFVPVYVPIHLAEHRPARAELAFVHRAAVLAAVEARASLVYSRQLAGFERRRRAGFGEFLTPQQIEAKPEMRLGQLLQEMQGLELQRRTGQTIARMRASRGAGTRYCTPSLYVDGLLDRSGDLDLIYSSRIAAVEVYNREFSRPAEFADKNPCGAIVVWMRPHSELPPLKK